MNNTTPPFDNNDVEVVQRDVLYQGIFRLVRLHLRHRLFNGGWSEVFTREIMERYKSAAVLPYDPKLDRIILIEQFRSGALQDPHGPWQIEIPAGVIDSKETPLDVAIREAQEEAGCSVSNLELIYDYFISPGASNEYIHIYCGIVDAAHADGIHGLAQEHEDIRVLNVVADEALDLLKQGKIKNAPAIIALQWFALNRERLKEQSVPPLSLAAQMDKR